MTKINPPKDRLSDLIGKQNQIKIYWQEAHLKKYIYIERLKNNVWIKVYQNKYK